ncbi:hypothetical protein Tco_0010961 [Tanacetum coccineum]
MDITRDQQIALDDALVAPANRLKIGKSNLRLSSDLNSKEATLQVVYDVLKLTPFYKAFQITVDVPEIYMQEFWATATVHHHSIRFKMNNKKHIVNLEYFREMLQICPKLPDQQFEELPFEEEILTFLRDLGHSGEIKVITNVNVNKLHQPWRSFAAVISKCLSVHLLWEEFVYQVDNKNVKRSNEMYCPRLTKVIVNFFLTKDQSIPRRNKAEPSKTKASVKKKQARSDKAPKAPKGKRLKATSKVTKPSKKKLPDQGLETLSEVSLTEEEQMRIVTKRSLTQFQVHAQQISSNEDDDAENKNDDDDDDVDNQDDDGQEYDVQDDENQDDDIEQIDSDNDGDDFVHLKFSNHDEEDKEEDSFDPRVQTPSHVESTDDEDSDEEIQSPDTGIDSIFNLNTELTSLVDVPVTTIAEPPLLSATILPPPPTPLITHLQLKNHSSHTSNYSNLLPTRSSQLCIVDAYLANKMHKAVKTAVQLQSDRLRDEAQAENKDFINKLDNNIKKIIKDQDKEQVKAQVSKILPKIKKTINEQLKAKVLTRSSNESKTSHAKNLYKELVDAYESDKLILDTFGDTVSFKRRRDDEDKDKEPFGRSNQGSKRRRAKKELESINTPKEKTSKTTGKSTKGSIYQMFQKPVKPPTLDRDWNKTLPATHVPVQPWLSTLAQKEDTRDAFNEHPPSKLDWNNPEGQQYPHDLRKSLPLIPNSRGRQVIPFNHFINNDLAYLNGGVSAKIYNFSDEDQGCRLRAHQMD